MRLNYPNYRAAGAGAAVQDRPDALLPGADDAAAGGEGGSGKEQRTSRRTSESTTLWSRRTICVWTSLGGTDQEAEGVTEGCREGPSGGGEEGEGGELQGRGLLGGKEVHLQVAGHLVHHNSNYVKQ